MHRGLLVVTAVGAACSGAPTPPPPPPAPPARTIASDAEPLYRAVAQPAVRALCGHGKPLVNKLKLYEFEGGELFPVSYGPRLKDAPRGGTPRTVGPLARSVTAATWKLRACYRWARWQQPDLAGTVTAELDIDELGVVTATAGPGELGACVADVLATLHARPLVPRRTHAVLPIAFAPSGQARPKQRPPRPDPPQGHAEAIGCVMVPDDVPLDRLVAEAPVASVDDFDEAQAAQEELERRIDEWRRGGQKGPRPRRGPPRVMIGGPGAPTATRDKASIRRQVRGDAGELSACYASALAAHTALTGTATLELRILADGSVAGTAMSSAGDPGLEACLKAAVAGLWFQPAPGEAVTSVSYVFTLAAPLPPAAPLAARATVDEVAEAAAVALAAHDGELALRRYSALLAQAPDDARACSWRVGALQAVVVAAPWLDARADAAARDLVDRLVARPEPACAEAAAAPLAELAMVAHSLGDNLLDDGQLALAVQRYRMALEVPGLPDAADLQQRLDRALSR